MARSNSIMYGAIIYSLFVGVVYSAFAILGLLSRWCIIETQNSPLVYMFYMFYFRVEKCEPKFQWRKFNIINFVDVIMPGETEAVRRTYIFTITYLVLHIALIAFALLALCGVRFTVKRKRFFFLPLVFILIATVIFDVLATVYYVVDFVFVLKNDGLMQILEVINMKETRPNFEQLAFSLRYVPPVAMFLITSKLVFFLICNIVWAVTIVHTTWSKKEKSQEAEPRKANGNAAIMANDNPAYENDSDEKMSTNEVISKDGHSEKRYNDTSREQDFVYPHQLYATSTKQKKTKSMDDDVFDDDSIDFKIQRPVLSASYYNHSRKLQQFPNSTYDNDIENRLNRFHTSNGNLEYDEISPDISYKEMKIRPTPPPKPNRLEFNSRPSSSYYLNSTGHEDLILYRPDSGLDDSKADRLSGHVRTPQELRSQLPWSYFNMSDDVPKHALVHTEDTEIPGTPLPDYDMNVPKRRHY
ncbi:uncharacterized protein [Chironomus tepperi]|uniref:uncharacterized protein n=1 Tax=Chironomus tepperi TaxID=113505 RepID=UPI00391EFD19